MSDINYYAVCTKRILENENWEELKEEYARMKPYYGDVIFYCQRNYVCNHFVYTFLDENKKTIVYTLPEGVIEAFESTYYWNGRSRLIIEFTNAQGEVFLLKFNESDGWHFSSSDDEFNEVVKLIQSLRKGTSYKDYCEQIEQRLRLIKMQEAIKEINYCMSKFRDNLSAVDSVEDKDSMIAMLQEKMKRCEEIVNKCESTLTELNKTM